MRQKIAHRGINSTMVPYHLPHFTLFQEIEARWSQPRNGTRWCRKHVVVSDVLKVHGTNKKILKISKRTNCSPIRHVHALTNTKRECIAISCTISPENLGNIILEIIRVLIYSISFVCSVPFRKISLSIALLSTASIYYLICMQLRGTLINLVVCLPLCGERVETLVFSGNFSLKCSVSTALRADGISSPWSCLLWWTASVLAPGTSVPSSAEFALSSMNSAHSSSDPSDSPRTVRRLP